MNIIDTEDGSPTLFSDQYNETYHSTFGAITESKHVFLNASGVARRLDAQQSTTVLEVGFGLGLNALVTCDYALLNDAPLNFHSLENDLTICSLVQTIDYSSHLRHPEISVKLKAALEPLITMGSPVVDGIFQSHERIRDVADISGLPTSSTVIALTPKVTIFLHWGDACTVTLPNEKFNAVYLDAFSPDNNSDCWRTEFLSSVRTSMKQDGRLSTYCAKGSVRRALLQAHFSVKKIAGPPGKREMMVAIPNC